MNDVTFWFFI